MNKRLCLSGKDKKIAGVCGGISEYFNLEPALVRIIWILLLIMFKGLPLIVYIICWAVMPSKEY